MLANFYLELLWSSNRDGRRREKHELGTGQEAGESEPQGQEEPQHHPSCFRLILVKEAQSK